MTQTLTDKKINDAAQRQVAAALREILSDPDRGLSLRRSTVQKLRKSLRSKKEGKVKNLNEFLKAYGV
jgi:Na+-translocating ferredoxin:NAD+ oxidoreductase RnfG subunit